MNRYKILWNDGYIGTLLCGNGKWKIEGARIAFKSLETLESYYNGKILTFKRIK